MNIKPEELVNMGCDPSHVADWYQTRKDKRAPKLTQTALRGIIKQAELAGMTLAQAVQMCAEEGWRGFKAEWVNNQQRQQQKTNRSAVATAMRDINNTDW